MPRTLGWSLLMVVLSIPVVGAAAAGKASEPTPGAGGGAAAVAAAVSGSATTDMTRVFQGYVARGLPSDGVLLLVSVARQTMTVIREGRWLATIPVSTSRNGVGSAYGSCKTPLGLHRVAERFGEGEPLGRVFVARVATDRISKPSTWQQDAKEDLVLTRILRLAGMEDGVNKGTGVDSFRRCIYIHGTNEEHLLGTPASHGCVRVANRRMLALFGIVGSRETWCDILP